MSSKLSNFRVSINQSLGLGLGPYVGPYHAGADALSCKSLFVKTVEFISTSLLSSLDQLDVRTATSVQTYDFSTLYTSIPHNLLKSRITALIHNSFKRRNGSNRYTHIKIMRGKGYFIDTINPGGDNLYTADQICRMVEFLIDNIFVKFGGSFFVRSLGFQWERIVPPC